MLKKVGQFYLFVCTVLLSLQVSAQNIVSYYASKNINPIFNLPYTGVGVSVVGVNHNGDYTNFPIFGGSYRVSGGKYTIFGANIFTGYGITIKNNWYLGGELYFNYLPSKDTDYKYESTSSGVTQSTYAQIKSSYDYGALIRAGYFPTANTLVYALMGGDLSSFRVKRFYNTTVNPQSNQFNRAVTGFMPGVGVEVQLPHELALRAQYNYIFYSGINHTFAGNRTKITNLNRNMFTLAILCHFAFIHYSPMYMVDDMPLIGSTMFNHPYVGVDFNVIDFANKSFRNEIFHSASFQDSGSHRRSNIGGTGDIGYGSTILNRYYLGGEAYFRYANLTNYMNNVGSGYMFRINNQYEYGMDVKGGVLLTPNTLLYGLFAVENAKFNFKFVKNIGAPENYSWHAWKIGFGPGVGIETALLPKMSLRVQYAYILYPGKSARAVPHAGYTNLFRISNLSKGVFSIGLAYYV